MKHEWKKAEKDLYLPKQKPELIKIPSLKFFSINGQGDPNEKPFVENIGILFSLAYAVKMSLKNGFAPSDYFDYTVYPLEGILDLTEEAKKMQSHIIDKSSLIYNLMISQPDFVTPGKLKTVLRFKIIK